MNTVAHHRRIVGDLVGGGRTTTVDLASAVGLVLASPVAAEHDLPMFDNSAVDGFAVRTADLHAGGGRTALTVVDVVAAGDSRVLSLGAGEAMQIMTGAATPLNADRIVPVEQTAGFDACSVDRQVEFVSEPDSGNNIRRCGEDIGIGSVVVRPGTVLTPRSVAALAALGLAAVDVYAPPRVLVLSTGSELRPQGTTLRHGHIFESNAVMLCAAIREAGAQAIQLLSVSDDISSFHRALDPYLSEIDLIVTTSGVGVGAFEVVRQATEGEGVQFTTVGMKPGRPQGAGMYRGVPLVAFPGNPVSAYISFEVFLRARLRDIMGYRDIERRHEPVALSTPLPKRAGVRQFLLAGIVDGKFEPLGSGSSSSLSSLMACEGLLEVDDGVGMADRAVAWSLS